MRPDGTFDFEALSDAQKEEIYQECEKIGPGDDRPLTAVQRRLFAKIRARGRIRAKSTGLIGVMKGKIKVKGDVLSTGSKWDAER